MPFPKLFSLDLVRHNFFFLLPASTISLFLPALSLSHSLSLSRIRVSFFPSIRKRPLSVSFLLCSPPLLRFPSCSYYSVLPSTFIRLIREWLSGKWLAYCVHFPFPYSFPLSFPYPFPFPPASPFSFFGSKVSPIIISMLQWTIHHLSLQYSMHETHSISLSIRRLSLSLLFRFALHELHKLIIILPSLTPVPPLSLLSPSFLFPLLQELPFPQTPIIIIIAV